MADHTSIEWTDATWNPVTGCSVVSPGCTNCYAMRLAGTRLKHTPSRKDLTRETKAGPVWTGEVRLNEEWLDQPLRWRRPRRIFVCAHGDLFAENVQDEWIDRVFAVMALSPQHTFQVFTKRAKRMRDYVSGFGCDGARRFHVADAAGRLMEDGDNAYDEVANAPWPLPNAWLGVSAERQQEADERIPHLLDTPAAIRFVSAEPLLGPVDFGRIPSPVETPEDEGYYHNALVASDIHFYDADPDVLTGRAITDAVDGPMMPHLDWIIVGGESGNGARPMHPDWPRSIRDQRAAAGVPFFFKQWGSWAPISHIAESSDLYHPAPVGDPEGLRRCRYANLVMHADGKTFDRGEANDYNRRVTLGAHAAGSGSMMMFAVGKKCAGRLLDGVEHNAFPDIREVRFG